MLGGFLEAAQRSVNIRIKFSFVRNLSIRTTLSTACDSTFPPIGVGSLEIQFMDE